jgi:hypothetical protein
MLISLLIVGVIMPMPLKAIISNLKIIKIKHFKMKHLKLFKESASYEAWKNSEDFILPNVVFNEETNGIVFEPYAEPSSPNLVCTYNVTDTSRAKTILYGYALKYITGMIVDGVETDVETMYQFDTEGLHTIEYILDDNTALPDTFFQNNESIISIEIPNTVSTVSSIFVYYGVENLKEIIFHSPICPTISGGYFGYPTSGTSVIVKYPKGADYSEIITNLPEGWTAVEF